MRTPPYLKPGDKIGIVATARKISPEELQPAIEKFKEWGLQVALGNNIYAKQNQFAGSDEQRSHDLQQMLDDENIKAIIIARGGYGTLRIIDRIDFTNFVKHPKWIIGYSDVTVLHSHIHQNFLIETLHATMPLKFPANGIEDNALTTLKKVLFGGQPEYTLPSDPLDRKGNTEGIITGGNLSLLYALAGTASDIDTNGKILFIEDLDEYLYHIDRMMMQLKRSGKLNKLAGLVVGGMTEMRDNEIPFGKTAKEIIAEAVAEYDYPVCFEFPAGHIDDNRALILGRKAELEVNEKSVRLKFCKE
jgi:muramoyltetrapeptide carboxypeptidase